MDYKSGAGNLVHATEVVKLLGKKELRKPTLFVATLLMEVYGDMRMSPPGSNLEAMCVAGPLPSDLPSKIISFSRKLVMH